MIDLRTPSAALSGKITTFRFPRLADERGALSPVDLAELGFNPVRAFLVEAPRGASRGGHGHREGRQLLLRVSGRIEIALAWNGETGAVVLDEEVNGLMIEAPVWSRQTYLEADSRMMVLCDTPYDPDGYLRERP